MEKDFVESQARKLSRAQQRVEKQREVIKALVQWLVIVVIALLCMISLCASYMVRFYNMDTAQKCKSVCSWSESSAAATDDGTYLIVEKNDEI